MQYSVFKLPAPVEIYYVVSDNLLPATDPLWKASGCSGIFSPYSSANVLKFIFLLCGKIPKKCCLTFLHKYYNQLKCSFVCLF